MFKIVASPFWNFIILIGIIIIILYGVEYIVHKSFGLKRKKIWSREYMSDTHKSLENKIRNIFLGFLFIGFIITIWGEPSDPPLYLEPFFMSFIFIFVTGVLDVVMEKKHAQNKKQYIASIIELIVISIICISVFIYI